MKLSDIDQNLNEAPVNLFRRAATKLKKHTPFAPGARAEAEGQDEMEAAANAVALAFRKWLGTTNLRSKNAIPQADLMKFFTSVNMGKTAEEIIGDHPKAKKQSQGAGEKASVPTDTGSEDMISPEEMLGKTAESLEARLANMLNEAPSDEAYSKEEWDAAGVFTKKEAEQIILDVVGKIYKDNPQGLDSWLQAKGVRAEPSAGEQGEETQGEETQGNLPDNIEQLEAMWDQMISNQGLDDKAAKVMKAAFDNAKKAVASGKVSTK